MLTYYLDRKDLKESWQKVLNTLPLEGKKNNGRVDTLMEAVDLLFKFKGKSAWNICKREAMILEHWES
jgi:hypothetical protein